MSPKLETEFDPVRPPTPNLHPHLDRILKSEPFRGSETLRNLLSYLGACASEPRARTVKVHEIAKAVFGRAEDFDSQTDSIVRVHTGRLRSKLAEYYINEGADEQLILSIPKGSYNLALEPRAGRPVTPEDVQPGEPEILPSRPLQQARARGVWRALNVRILVSVVLAALLGWTGASLFRRHADDSLVAPALRTFWQNFVNSQGTPVIVFSNLTKEDSGHPGQLIANTFTTNGEVMGVFGIAQTLSLFNKPVRAKPGGLLTWDDAKDSDLVFVGGPLAETPLRDFALFKEFQFKPGASGDTPQPSAIVNLHPRKGESQQYVGDLSRPVQFDYGLIALRPALDPKRHALALAGIDYYGTQAAVEFVTRVAKTQELLARLNVKNGSPMPSFEALIYVKTHGGVPVQSEIVTVRRVDK